MTGFVSVLNDAQKEAVMNTEGPLLIVAGAGSGKTRALTYRIAYLIRERGVKPWNILAVTFTNKAAGEMKDRVLKLVGGQPHPSPSQTPSPPSEDLHPSHSTGHGLERGSKEEELLRGGNLVSSFARQGWSGQLAVLPTVGTFHSVCVQLLRREIHQLGYEHEFTIFDDSDQLALLKRIMKKMDGAEQQLNPKAIRNRISALKNLLKTPEEAMSAAMDSFTRRVAEVYEVYQKELRQQGGLDFDDLIMQTVMLFRKFPRVLEKYQDRWRYLLVDEYQDVNYAQYILIQMLGQAYRNVCVVGDPDQNIYSWRGADISYIMQFAQDYPEAKVVKLEQNYRSSAHILGGAEAVISKNKGRIEKKLWTENPEGDKVLLVAAEDERREAEWVLEDIRSRSTRYGENVVLYRTNAQSRQLEEACLRYGIPYKVIGGVKFYARKEVKDMVAYLRLIHNHRDDAALLRIINAPSRKIGEKTLEVLQERSRVTGLSLFATMDSEDRYGLSESKWEMLQKFVYLVERLKEFSREFSVSTLIKEVLIQSGYKKMLEGEGEEGEVRLENILELVSVASKYDDLEVGVGLVTFLEEVSLVSDTDELQGQADYVTLMTLHAAKGLEFEHVYIVGLEEGIFPSSRSFYDPEQAAEERRLMYVGMTRAMRRLHLVWAKRRFLFGETSYNPPSSFLKDIPLQHCEGDVIGGEEGEEVMVERMRVFDWQMTRHVQWTDTVEGRISNIQNPTSNEISNANFQSSTLNNQDFRVGDRVAHKMFGEGEIVDLKGDIASIRFDSAVYGVKKLALNVAPVRKL